MCVCDFFSFLIISAVEKAILSLESHLEAVTSTLASTSPGPSLRPALAVALFKFILLFGGQLGLFLGVVYFSLGLDLF